MGGSRYARPVAALLACATLLSACGSSSEGPSRPGARIGEAGPAPGAPPVGSPGMERAPASVLAASVVAGADALFATGLA